MTPDLHWDSPLARDVQFGYLTEGVDGPRQHNPRVVLNNEGGSILRVLKEEIRRCRSFTFSVAFVSPSAIAMLKTDLLEFRGKGTIITSDYLAFNSPQAFAELLSLGEQGFDVRIHTAKAFHPKGYIFQHDNKVSAMVGSANLTAGALVRNHEWNLLVSAATSGDLAVQLRDLVRQQLLDSTPITHEWVTSYSAAYTAPPTRPARGELPPAGEPTTELPPTWTGDEEGPAAPSPSPGSVVALPAPPAIPAPLHASPATTSEAPVLLPNQMQREALREIETMRAQGFGRAVVISATGTGKTILSALAVKAANPRRMLFVVHREQIIDRTIEEYRRVLGGPASDFGKLSGTVKQVSARYLFATVQSLSRPDVLQSMSPETFDYVVIDEAHRAAAASHRRVMDHFTPQFLLGMTATPERMDGFNVFELFDYNVPYEIRLSHALESNMLSPFHYYGVTDVTFEDGSTTSDVTELPRLASTERVSHIISALEKYGQAGVQPRGLMFVSRKDEAIQLSTALNERSLRGRRLRTLALTGDDPVARRESAVRELEAGHLDYIITVDVFNEGVDIPSINQVVMLRQTKSAIVFVQQLGRGLRKAPDKDYLVVIDFIGNYANNYMIPIALFGDDSLNKESLRRNLIAAEERGVIAGLSSVQFDRISHARVLKAVTDVKLDSMRRLKAALEEMRNRLGRTPDLWDFVRFESADPVVLANTSGNFPTLLTRALKVTFNLSPAHLRALTLLSGEVLTSKRPHDALVTRLLIENPVLSLEDVRQRLEELGVPTTARVVESSLDTLTLAEHAEADVKRYREGIAHVTDGLAALTDDFREAYQTNNDFRHAVDDLLRTAQHLAMEQWDRTRVFTPGHQYGRKEVARLLTWPRKWTSTIYGYRVNHPTASCPIFVTLHKSDEVSASTAYEDALVDRRTMVWFTRSRRTLHSAEVASIVTNEVALHVFVKKDDAEGTDFYYLGQAQAADAIETTMANTDGSQLPVVRMLLKFPQDIPQSLFDYFHPVVTS